MPKVASTSATMAGKGNSCRRCRARKVRCSRPVGAIDSDTRCEACLRSARHVGQDESLVVCDYTFGLDKNKVLIPVPKKEKPTKKKVVTGKKTKAKVMKRPSDDDDFELGTPHNISSRLAPYRCVDPIVEHHTPPSPIVEDPESEEDYHEIVMSSVRDSSPLPPLPMLSSNGLFAQPPVFLPPPILEPQCYFSQHPEIVAESYQSYERVEGSIIARRGGEKMKIELPLSDIGFSLSPVEESFTTCSRTTPPSLSSSTVPTRRNSTLLLDPVRSHPAYYRSTSSNDFRNHNRYDFNSPSSSAMTLGLSLPSPYIPSNGIGRYVDVGSNGSSPLAGAGVLTPTSMLRTYLGI